MLSSIREQAFSKECVTEKQFSYFSTKTYVVGTQKNSLNETVFLNTQNMLKIMVKKYLQFYAEKSCLSIPMREHIALMLSLSRSSEMGTFLFSHAFTV